MTATGTDGDRGSRYAELGLRRAVNCMGAVTFLGGLPLSESVQVAMRAAYASKVDLFELNAAVGERIAALCAAEAAAVTSGAAGGIQLAAAACITRGERSLVARVPDLGGAERDEIVLHRKHRCNFDHAVRSTGARLVEFGYAWDGTERWELEAALSPRTAAVFYVASFGPPSVLPLSEVVEVAHAHGVPVIVDAAVALPPRLNLQAIPAAGVDLTCFSGGKAVAGPQNTGFVVGSADLVEACVANASPNHNTVGRPAKVNAEAMVGLLTALEEYAAGDDEDDYRVWTARLEHIADGAAVPADVGCRLERTSKNGMPIPTLRFTFPSRDAATAAYLRLRAWDPAVWLVQSGVELILDPHALAPNDVQIVTDALRRCLGTRTLSSPHHPEEDS